MATGNYALAGYMGDEGATHTNGLFLTETHAEKIDYSCSNYSRKAAPGSRWVYHTSDTYILGTEMNARLKALEGTSADIYTDTLLGARLLPLGGSPNADFPRRTYDPAHPPFPAIGPM